MDETLFRSYFKKLYKSLNYMEADFLALLDEEERTNFMIFTKSLQDLAQYFKCGRKQKKADEFAEINLSKKKITDITTKMIYGVGKEIQQPRSNSCKIVPAPMGGFFAVRKDH